MVKAYYQGYLWWNNAPRPTTLIGGKAVPLCADNEYPIALTRNDGTYVTEGLLWDKQRQVSYTIRHIDGHHIVIRTKLDQEKKHYKYISESSYYYKGSLSANGEDATDMKLCFVQFWKEEPDPLCENMNVLRPGKIVFVGFEDIG